MLVLENCFWQFSWIFWLTNRKFAKFKVKCHHLMDGCHGNSLISFDSLYILALRHNLSYICWLHLFIFSCQRNKIRSDDVCHEWNCSWQKNSLIKKQKTYLVKNSPVLRLQLFSRNGVHSVSIGYLCSIHEQGSVFPLPTFAPSQYIGSCYGHVVEYY